MKPHFSLAITPDINNYITEVFGTKPRKIKMREIIKNVPIPKQNRRTNYKYPELDIIKIGESFQLSTKDKYGINSSVQWMRTTTKKRFTIRTVKKATESLAGVLQVWRTK